MKVIAKTSREISMKICLIALLVTLALFLGGFQAEPVYAQQNVPEIQFDSVPDFPALPPGMNFGEVSGVAVNSKGHVFVFTRSNSANGPAYGGAAAQLFEFGPKGEFIREIGKGLYAWSEAHTVRIDKDDNIWAIDKGSDMVVKFNQAGRVVWVFGRRTESADEGAKPWEHPDPPLAPIDGMFRQPTDVTWDSEGNIYITSRILSWRIATTTSTSAIALTGAFRCSIPMENFCVCSPSTCHLPPELILFTETPQAASASPQ